MTTTPATTVRTTASRPLGHPDDKWGWAIQGALSIKNIPTGPGDTINMQGVYTDGATRYNFQSLATRRPTRCSVAPALAGAYQSIGFAGASDAVFNGTSNTAQCDQLQLTTTYGFRGGFNHNWDPYWSTSLYGAWAAVQYNGTAKGLYLRQSPSAWRCR